jgi:3-dehydroquinate dehydratase II
MSSLDQRLPDVSKNALEAIRRGKRRWVIGLIDGPNMKHLGKRDPRLFGKIGSIGELQELVVGFGASLGVDVRPFVSDHEGDLLEHVHASGGSTDGYLLDAGGLTTVSEGLRHALQETKKPVVEVAFYNLIANGEISVFTPTVIGRAMGFREYSYLAGLLGLVLALDDESFLNPDAPASPIARRNGQPYVFTNG